MPNNLPQSFDYELVLHPMDVRSSLDRRLAELVPAVIQDPSRKTAEMRRLSRDITRFTRPITIRGARQGADAISAFFLRDQGIPSFGIVTLETFRNVVSAATGGRAVVDINPRGDRVTVRWESALMDAALSGHQSYRSVGVYTESNVQYVDRSYTSAVLDELYAAWGRRMAYVREYRHRHGILRVEEERKVNVRSGTGNFTEFWRQRLSHPIYNACDNDNLEQIEILPHGTLASRNWGIEIEAVDIEGIRTPAGWDLKGDGSLEGVYTGDPDQRHAPECGGYDDEDYGCDDYDGCMYSSYSTTGEWTSPILRSFHSRGLEYLCGGLEGRPSNSSPGVHVHVSAADLTPVQAARVSMFYTLLEPLFEQAYQRETRGYCESLTAGSVLSNMRNARDAQRSENAELRRPGRFYTGGRYVTVNLSALSSHGTIEFRAMGPVYDYEHLTRWATLCRELVNLGASRVSQREVLAVTDMEGLIALFAKYGSETPQPDSLRTGDAELPEGPETAMFAGLWVQNDDYALARV